MYEQLLEMKFNTPYDRGDIVRDSHFISKKSSLNNNTQTQINVEFVGTYYNDCENEVLARNLKLDM